jgi:hypothetical protein
VAQILTWAAAIVAFLALYAFLRNRSGRKSGTTPPVQWSWLAAIAGCVLIAVLAGLVL